MRHDPRKHLEDVRLAIEDILEFTRGRSLEDYVGNKMLRGSVERAFIVIGEALLRLRREHDDLACSIGVLRKIIGFRNVLVHDYERVKPEIVWGIVVRDLVQLNIDVQKLFAQMSSEEQGRSTQ